MFPRAPPSGCVFCHRRSICQGRWTRLCFRVFVSVLFLPFCHPPPRRRVRASGIRVPRRHVRAQVYHERRRRPAGRDLSKRRRDPSSCRVREPDPKPSCGAAVALGSCPELGCPTPRPPESRLDSVSAAPGSEQTQSAATSPPLGAARHRLVPTAGRPLAFAPALAAPTEHGEQRLDGPDRLRRRPLCPEGWRWGPTPVQPAHPTDAELVGARHPPQAHAHYAQGEPGEKGRSRPHLRDLQASQGGITPPSPPNINNNNNSPKPMPRLSLVPPRLAPLV
ncbi:hypothetical protein VTK73DRAFT_3618 [Phialemonium thermophilum]|uniref:Uncharacterized protein n=1 Tax=Phialemonium thermophilum TaxID=223376 RepID=A0ABR3VHS0_9PEZI